MTTRITAVIALACLLASSTATASSHFDSRTTTHPSLGPWTSDEPVASKPDPAQQANVKAAMAELPLCFEQNLGQSDEQVAFLSHASGYGLFLTPDEMVLSLPHAVEQSEAKRAPLDVTTDRMRSAHEAAPRQRSVLRMHLEGAMRSTPVGEQQLETKTNYFIGNDPSRWQTDIPNFARVRYPQVYPGVDLVYYSSHGQLEYDFEVAAGADPSAIMLAWDGAESIDVDDSGTLVLKFDGGEVRQQMPAIYQEADFGKTAIAGRFAARGGRVGIELGAYDASKPLVIDPVLSYSTYLGGGHEDTGWGIAVDSSHAAYVTGNTYSSDFPVASAFDPTHSVQDFLQSDAFVTKLNAAGDALVYSTYLGGTSEDAGADIAVDSAGQASVAGETESCDFPTQRAYDSTCNGRWDVFVVRLTAAGSALSASTYLGGNSSEYSTRIALSTTGAYVYVTGYTASVDFPTLSAFDAAQNGDWDVFVTKLAFKPSGTFLYYSTYLGGSDDDFPLGLAVDASGAAYVSGSTYSTDFPTVSARDATLNGREDAFVTKLSPTGSALVYSTYLGGSAYDGAGGIAVDASGAAYITGGTSSVDFPTVSAFDATYNGNNDAFVTKLSPAGNALVYSTFLGGGGLDGGHQIAVDSSHAAYVSGQTQSTNFPTASALDVTYNGGYDAFVTKLNPAGNALVYSTYLGGSADEVLRDMAVDSSGAAFITGYTTSTDFPTASPFDATLNGVETDAFVAKLF